MNNGDRLRERAHQIDMAQNGLSLPWAKKHLSPMLRESADRIAALESLIRDMWAGMCGYDHDCRVCTHFDYRSGECEFRRRMKELGVDK